MGWTRDGLSLILRSCCMYLTDESNRLYVGISSFEEDYKELQGIVTTSQQYLQLLSSEKTEDVTMTS